MSDSEDLKPYDPKEAQEQFRSMVHKGGKWLLRAQLAVALATLALVFFNGLAVWLTYQQVRAVRTSIEQAQRHFELSQRPWVAHRGATIEDVEIGKTPKLTVRPRSDDRQGVGAVGRGVIPHSCPHVLNKPHLLAPFCETA
jgi:hypothetical protein